MIKMDGNLNIYILGDKISENKISVWCNDWNDMLWEITIELTLTWEDAEKLYDNILPGYHTEWSLGLGQRVFVDTSYAKKNTLILEPLGKLSEIYDETKIVVKHYDENPINKYYASVRINGYILKDW
jgi:hypothetical protein